MGHDHGHGVGAGRGRLAAVLVITVVALAAEVYGAARSGSLSLLGDAGHMLSDSVGLAVALAAAVLMVRPPSQRRTWGFLRAEVLAALLQAAILLVVGVWVVVQGIRRLVDPPPVDGGSMLVFGAIGLAANLIALAVLSSARRHSLNLRAAFLEVAADALGSVAVLIAAAVIAGTGWLRADAVASLAIGLLIFPRTLLLLRDTLSVLLESTPRHIDTEDVRARLLTHEHVHAVHDLHITEVATGLPTLTAHAVVSQDCFHDGHRPRLLDELQACLVDDFDIEHSTIQFEAPSHAAHEHDRHA